MVGSRSLRLFLVLLSVTQCALVVGIGVVCWAIFDGDAAEPNALNSGPIAMAAEKGATEAVSDLRPLDWYAPIWQRDLRQEPIPPVAQKKEEPKPTPAPRPNLPRLLGTFVEDTKSWTYWATSDSRRAVASVDDVVDRFAVVDIQPGRAQLQYADSLYWVEVDRPEPLIASRR